MDEYDVRLRAVVAQANANAAARTARGFVPGEAELEEVRRPLNKTVELSTRPGLAELDEVRIATGMPVLPIAGQLPNHTCHYCLRAVATTRDHIVPRVAGGENRWWNLVPSCERCNTRKSERPPICPCLWCRRAVAVHSRTTDEAAARTAEVRLNRQAKQRRKRANASERRALKRQAAAEETK